MSSGLDWERFGVITGGDEACILPPPTLSEKEVGIPPLVHFPFFLLLCFVSFLFVAVVIISSLARFL